MVTRFEDWAVIYKRLALAFGHEVSVEQARAYHAVLQRFPRMALVAASMRLMEQGVYFPRISEISAAAAKLGGGYELTDWGRLDEAMQWYLYTHSLTCSDELTEADVVRIRKDAGVDPVGHARPVRELSAAEVRAVCQARGWPVGVSGKR